MSNVMSPFAPADLYASADGGQPPPAPVGEALLSPFAEPMMAEAQGALDAQVAEALLAEFADEEFAEALDALADEVAGRHLRGAGTWSASGAPVLDLEQARAWMDSVAGEADRVLSDLEAYFGDRPVDSLREGEVSAAAGRGDGDMEVGPLDAQEYFLDKLVKKVKKVAQGVGKLAKKGLAVVGKFLPLGQLFAMLRKLIRPLLDRVLQKAIGKLPAPLRPLATRLAGKLRGAAGLAGAGELADDETPDDEYGPRDALADEFDQQLAELVLAPNEAVVEQLLTEADAVEDGLHEYGAPGPLHDLDAARQRLARELAEAVPGEPPTAQMEQFIPAVMAAMPLIKAGVRIIGRQRVENFVAGALAKLISGMVGPQAAQLLSRHIASAGLGLLGLEAETGDPTVGMEALVAAAEDTVRQVMSLPAASLADELLVEAEVQEAFADAAARHLPAAVLRPEVVETEAEGGHAIWVLMPRATRPCFRYKKYGRLIPVRISRPLARSVQLSGGDTLERRLLDAGVRAWPVAGEMEVYELLEGGDLGHVAAFEGADPDGIAAVAGEFERLDATAAGLLAGHPRLAMTGRRGRPGRGRRGGARYYRLRVGGRPLRRRRLFALRLDLTAPQPVLALHLCVGERDAHALAAHLERRDLVQVVSTVRRLLDPAAQRGIAQRLTRTLRARGVQLPPDAAQQLAGRLADAALRAVSAQLPAAAATLAQAAKDPAAGVTLTFGFTFTDKDAITAGEPATPTLTIRPGKLRD
jgi:hypothetical protein